MLGKKEEEVVGLGWRRAADSGAAIIPLLSICHSCRAYGRDTSSDQRNGIGR